MNQHKHTPGPWSVFFGPDPRIIYPGIESESGVSVVVFGSEFDLEGVSGKTADERKANARLIAAAPDLLEALESSLDAMNRLDQTELGYLVMDEVKKASAAIAKATSNPS